MVANPVRGLLDRKRSEEHLLQRKLEREHENKTKQKQNNNDKKQGTITQSICQKNIKGHSI